MRLLAIDPGPTESAYVVYDLDEKRPLEFEKLPNLDILDVIHDQSGPCRWFAVEMIASYGMPVGAEVFETCIEIGRMLGCWLNVAEPIRVFRREAKLHLCGSVRAKDANIRQALIDRYGGKDAAIGRKATPGSLYGMAGDCWAALSVAITAAETRIGASTEVLAA